ncbi:ocs element-binding factor 1 [Oryza sativa Japonica Group]|uniref:Os03g0770000 protein n=3 Tax=Oryza sativa subsp. japonica TaxID=39947 RepID=A0A0N7KI44_ORYSJ|nr:ocs element-binding factor 1 [Oryza sativa Japonica Group]KAB8093758.1 hypothetical protein EE612_020695 [Oryza sativa]KAF2941536.1 hypothetical protein DAI22_03g354500 [Oryza sativa Japonica Group]BAS86585.1 Os03g0770000 [Oryza sativa Japonica Group]
MLSVQEALDFDLDAMTSGFGFTPWAADTCPTLEQLMASSASPSPSSSLDDNAAAAEEENGEVEEEEERRRQRRKVSNRLSARRSRARKQQRLEELRGESARLRAENRELAARLHAVARHGLAARCQNARLRAEAAALARRLLALQRLARGRHMMITASPPQFSRR